MLLSSRCKDEHALQPLPPMPLETSLMLLAYSLFSWLDSKSSKPGIFKQKSLLRNIKGSRFNSFHFKKVFTYGAVNDTTDDK